MCEMCRSHPCDPMCPNASEPEIMGVCANCDEELRADCTYFSDFSDNVFCSKECAIEYHEIEEKEWDDV
ncbi:MAG: hypothetical protein J1E85_10305 [Ruminococcus sp.]|nr:hypothetical protein [Ruminococcus sp.]